jgi:hypothetical protein
MHFPPMPCRKCGRPLPAPPATARGPTVPDELVHLRAVNASLRREIRTPRQEIAALRQERRAILDADRPNVDAAAGWIA